MSKPNTRNDYVNTELYEPHLFKWNEFKNNKARNDSATIAIMHNRMFREMMANRFVWTGLPDTVDVRYLELTLMNKGLVVFFKNTDNDSFMALNARGSGQLNMYGNYSAFTVYGPNMVPIQLSTKKCVPIWANKMRMSELDVVENYSRKLGQLDMTIEINSLAARRTKIITVEENQRLSVNNIIDQINRGEPAIKVHPGFDPKSIQAFDLGVDPKAIAELHILRTRLYNEAVGYLGINGANQDKKERLVEAEVGANDEQIQIMQAIYLNERQIAAEQINTMWPELDIKVEFFSEEKDVRTRQTEDEDAY
jgi:hypothetical protein